MSPYLLLHKVLQTKTLGHTMSLVVKHDGDPTQAMPSDLINLCMFCRSSLLCN